MEKRKGITKLTRDWLDCAFIFLERKSPSWEKRRIGSGDKSSIYTWVISHQRLRRRSGVQVLRGDLTNYELFSFRLLKEAKILNPALKVKIFRCRLMRTGNANQTRPLDSRFGLLNRRFIRFTHVPLYQCFGGAKRTQTGA